jgi:hypothetical protein
MKTVAVGLCLVLSFSKLHAQSDLSAAHIIEGSKIIIELIKVLASKKELAKIPGCKNSYADVCIRNEFHLPFIVTMLHRSTSEKRELVIQPQERECSLHLPLGVWTYDVRLCEQDFVLRKGDLLVEGCQNIDMNIK